MEQLLYYTSGDWPVEVLPFTKSEHLNFLGRRVLALAWWKHSANWERENIQWLLNQTIHISPKEKWYPQHTGSATEPQAFLIWTLCYTTLSVFCLQASPLLSCSALGCPLLRSAERHRVAPVECDDHGLDKALHSWPLVPLWKFVPGSRDHRERVASVYLPLARTVRQALPTPALSHDCHTPLSAVFHVLLELM